MILREAAPAKVNLCLHVTGRRADGYHLLDSLAVFAGAADMLHAEPAEALSLRIAGPFGAGLSASEDNLVMRAARALDPQRGARLVLDKTLPVASGIGGGSADAAATLRLLSRLWGVATDLPALALGLGADVPVCLARVPARMQGVGEVLSPVVLPRFGLILVNPGVAVPTGAVFAALAKNRVGWSAPLCVPVMRGVEQMAGWLRGTRNDLQAPAIALCPVIADVLAAIAAVPGCLLARMSGSGATCFGVFAEVPTAAMPASWWSWRGQAEGAAPPG